MNIQVPMDVSRVEPVGGAVQVWGYVGDYEICIYMTKQECADRGLIVPPRERRARRVNHMTIAESLYKENGGEQ